MIQMNLFTKQKHTHRLREGTYSYWWERRKERLVREFGMDLYILVYLEWITNKVLLHSTGYSAQGFVGASMGGEFGGEDICVCMTVSLLCPPETIKTLLISYTPIKKFKKL